MSKLTVAGIGPGEADYILPAVIEKMKKDPYRNCGKASFTDFSKNCARMSVIQRLYCSMILYLFSQWGKLKTR